METMPWPSRKRRSPSLLNRFRLLGEGRRRVLAGERMITLVCCQFVGEGQCLVTLRGREGNQDRDLGIAFPACRARKGVKSYECELLDRRRSFAHLRIDCSHDEKRVRTFLSAKRSYW